MARRGGEQRTFTETRPRRVANRRPPRIARQVSTGPAGGLRCGEPPLGAVHLAGLGSRRPDHVEPPERPAPAELRIPSRPAPERPVPQPTRRRNRRVILAALVLAAALAVALAAVLTPRLGRHHAPPRAAPRGSTTSPNSVTGPAAIDRPTRQAAGWVARNVPAGTPLFAARSAITALREAGLLRTVSTPATAAKRPDGYLVVTPSSRPALGHSAMLLASLPIAAFGAGAAMVELRQVSHLGRGGLEQARARNLSDRKLAGTQLVANDRIVVSPAVRGQLEQGALDLRTATLAALLADRTVIHLNAVQRDPAERGADPAARSVVIALDRPVALQRALAIMPAAFQPDSVDVLPTGERRLRWRLSLSPVELLQ